MATAGTAGGPCPDRECRLQAASEPRRVGELYKDNQGIPPKVLTMKPQELKGSRVMLKSSFAAMLLALGANAVPAEGAPLPPAQQELVDAERAFVRLAAERGFRDSFYAWFADDGIAFNPHPFNVRAALVNQPSTGGPMGAMWAPAYGDVAEAGDLGWNTGPLVFEGRGGQPDRHGMFFSVWKRQSDGAWRVVLDVGADTPVAVVPIDTPFLTPHRPAGPARADGDVSEAIASLLTAERELLAAAASGSAGEAYASRLADDARIHRPGVMPVVGKDALAAWAAGQGSKLQGEPLLADVSRSGDLGYAYGSYEIEGANPQAGYFARVWKRNETGRWLIVMDTISPLPAGDRPLTAELLKGEEHYAARRWDEAVAVYQDYVQVNPDNAFAWHRLGTIQIQLGKYPEAIGNLEQAIRIGGGVPADFYNLACAYARAGETDKALDHVERAIRAGIASRQQYESDSDLASLRESARFKVLMQQLK